MDDIIKEMEDVMTQFSRHFSEFNIEKRGNDYCVSLGDEFSRKPSLSDAIQCVMSRYREIANDEEWII